MASTENESVIARKIPRAPMPAETAKDIGERDLPHPEDHEVEECRGAGIARAVERLRHHHPKGIERESGCHDPQAPHSYPQHSDRS